MVSTTWVLGCCCAFFTVVKKPVPASRPILDVVVLAMSNLLDKLAVGPLTRSPLAAHVLTDAAHRGNIAVPTYGRFGDRIKVPGRTIRPGHPV